MLSPEVIRRAERHFGEEGTNTRLPTCWSRGRQQRTVSLGLIFAGPLFLHSLERYLEGDVRFSPICYGEGKDWDLVSNHAHQGHKSGSLQNRNGCRKACSFCADFFSSAVSPDPECAQTCVLDWPEVG